MIDTSTVLNAKTKVGAAQTLFIAGFVPAITGTMCVFCSNNHQVPSMELLYGIKVYPCASLPPGSLWGVDLDKLEEWRRKHPRMTPGMHAIRRHIDQQLRAFEARFEDFEQY